MRTGSFTQCSRSMGKNFCSVHASSKIYAFKSLATSEYPGPWSKNTKLSQSDDPANAQHSQIERRLMGDFENRWPGSACRARDRVVKAGDQQISTLREARLPPFKHELRQQRGIKSNRKVPKSLNGNNHLDHKMKSISTQTCSKDQVPSSHRQSCDRSLWCLHRQACKHR